jgi:predicted Zn-dependent protease with MMP-like domain
MTRREQRRPGRRTARDRHGRGLRSPLLAADLPGARTRAEQFDQAVLDAAAELELRWPDQLQEIEFAVDDVPSVTPAAVLPSTDVVLDAGVPLTRFTPPGVDSRGRATKARIVVYRRPLELRAGDADDLSDLVAEVLAEQLSAVLGGSED